MTLKRIKKELLDLQKNPSTLFSAGPVNDNLFQWRAILFGPHGTPYENGRFHISSSFPSDYPFNPPKLTFITKIYHRCISMSDLVCNHCVSRYLIPRSPAITTLNVLEAYSSLLCNPTLLCHEGGMDEKDKQFKNDRVAHHKMARKWTQKYALD